ncbi:MAG: cupredoxin domain-containing protein [Chloroflexi bacterium]|nr:cupredoxin domain-containing protein [Chloroflexota bacterium]
MKQWGWNRILLSVLAIGSLLLAACTPATAIGRQHVEETTGGVREVVVKANEWSFAPTSIQLTAGQPVRLLLANEGKILHDMAVVGLDADVHEAAGHGAGEQHGEAKAGHAEAADHDTGGAKVHVNAEPGETGVLEFTPTDSGTFEFICTLPGHRQAGMIGKLMVAAGTGQAAGASTH